MTIKGKRILGITLGAIAIIMIAAGASAFITDRVIQNKDDAPVVHKVAATTHRDNIRWNNPPAQQPQQVAARCDDGNVVGYGLGALAGGLIGHQIGGGKGKDVATVGGAAAGALAGGQYIPTRGVLCQR
jgi:uncharacterized protein YcfJ